MRVDNEVNVGIWLEKREKNLYTNSFPYLPEKLGPRVGRFAPVVRDSVCDFFFVNVKEKEDENGSENVFLKTFPYRSFSPAYDVEKTRQSIEKVGGEKEENWLSANWTAKKKIKFLIPATRLKTPNLSSMNVSGVLPAIYSIFDCLANLRVEKAIKKCNRKALGRGG